MSIGDSLEKEPVYAFNEPEKKTGSNLSRYESQK